MLAPNTDEHQRPHQKTWHTHRDLTNQMMITHTHPHLPAIAIPRRHPPALATTLPIHPPLPSSPPPILPSMHLHPPPVPSTSY